MKRSCYKYCMIFLLFFFFFLSSNVCAETKPSENNIYKTYPYVIDQYDVNIIVNQDNSFDITETITAYFHQPRHGIYRTIPLKNTIERLDGTTSKNRVKITDLYINYPYKTTKENGSYKIQIGSADKTVVQKQVYTIKYHYDIGKDPMKDSDEFYYNIIGNHWDTVIGNVTFTITMPKAFDTNKLGFSLGSYGSTDSNNIQYQINGNTITGSYQGILKPNEAMTARIELEEGYFLAPSINFTDYLILIVPILFLLIAFILWYKFGRDNEVIETIEFYPPKGFNSLDIGFLYKGNATGQDVTSLLIYLANEGYIKISEIVVSKRKSFKITKLKEYMGNNLQEKLFLKGLFLEGGNKELTEVTEDDLYNRFYITMNQILRSVNNKKNRNEIFEKSASNKKIWIIGMIILTFCLITIPPMIDYVDFADIFIALLFPGVGFTAMFILIFGKNHTIYVNGKATNSSIVSKLFGLIWGGLFGGIPWVMMVLPILLEEPIYLIGYGIGIVCVLGMVICLLYLPKRTPYGNAILGQIKGFKTFLETAEKERLETMVKEDPTYFYHILPFTYVLGISDTWIKKFESIALQAPNWYDCNTAFHIATFSSFMNHTMTSATQTMTSSVSSSSGSSGFSSGGGFSGGGSGGGGGGSW